MELSSAENIKNILQKFNAKPKKGLGQNFLIDKNILQKIVESSNIKPDDVILEVGPGLGVLTQELAKKAKRVIAVEKDKTMCEILKENLKDFSAQGGPASGWKNIEIINDDILKISNIQYLISNKNTENLNFKNSIENWELGISNYKVVANIPYYLTSQLIRKFLEEKIQPQEIILMIQKEVAQRICAKVPDMNLLAVSVQFYAKPEIIFNVSKNSFWPIPKIDSAIIKITPRSQTSREAGGPTSPDLFFRIVKAGFSQPRKQLGGNLSKILKIKKEEVTEWLTKNNLSPIQRAETLSIQDWKNLATTLPQGKKDRE